MTDDREPDDQELIRRGVEQTGLNEEELRVYDSLAALGSSWFELPNRTPRNDALFTTAYDSIAGLLAMRAIKREHPEGWRTWRDELEEKGELSAGE